jgi:hypothetical protein
MIKRSPIILFCLLFFAFTLAYNYAYPVFLIKGTYVAHMPGQDGYLGVQEGDTLRIHGDGTFDSQSWGSGTYRIANDEITFRTENEAISTFFRKPYFYGRPRITIFYDLNAEFVKQ